MKRHTTIVGFGLSLVILIASGAAARAQDDPYEALRRYDFQERASLAAIQKEIVAARGAAQKLAAVETKLIGVLDDPSATFAGRQEACKFLSSMGTAKSVPALARMLAADARQADAARYALEHIPGPEASAALRRALSSASVPARIGIVNSIGARRDALAVPALARLAASPDRALSAAAIEALGNIGTEAALDALMTIRRGASAGDTVTAHAMLRCADGLARAGNKTRARSVYTALSGAGRPGHLRVTALRGLAALGAPDASALALAALKDRDGYVQRGAAQVLANAGDPAVTQKAIAAFGTASPEAQVVLLTGWGTRGASLAADTALRATASANAEVRAAAIRTAARTGGARAVPVLAKIAARSDGDAGLAREVLAAMAGTPAAQAILALARQGEPEVRAALMAVLAERPGSASLAALLQGARDTVADVAASALRGLAATGGGSEIQPIAAILTGTADNEVREAAARALVACVQRSGERDRATAPVAGALANASGEARIALLGVLAEIGGDRALAELKSAAASPDGEVRRAAVRALAETWGDSAPAPMLLDIARTDASPAIRVIALRGYIRLIGQDGGIPTGARIEALAEALRAAQRPDEKRQAFGALRDCREEKAVAALMPFLDDPELAAEAAEAILDLAAPQKRNNRDLPAVKGDAVAAALRAVVEKVMDEGIKDRARNLM